MDDIIKPKVAKSFLCKNCDFITSKICNYKKHLLSSKHLKNEAMMTNGDKNKPKEAKPIFACECGKEYKHRQGLSRHKKSCTLQEEENEPNIYLQNTTDPDKLTIITELFQEQLKENKELKEMLIEQNKKLIEIAEKNQGQITNNITNNNTNNNQFNLNFFLNEQCKDALNIMEFINQLQLNTTDLDMVGRVGYSEGISKLFIRGLKALDIFKRPVHCSDLKRETLYVKDKDSWEKDSDEKNKMKTAIKYIAAKNFKQINEWREKNPESDDYDSQKHMDYHQIVINSMGGATREEDDSNYNKIIRKVAKESVINKEITGK
jgi:hypothetical protein